MPPMLLLPSKEFGNQVWGAGGEASSMMSPSSTEYAPTKDFNEGGKIEDDLLKKKFNTLKHPMYIDI